MSFPAATTFARGETPITAMVSLSDARPGLTRSGRKEIVPCADAPGACHELESPIHGLLDDRFDVAVFRLSVHE
jgi:hypothetical protein